MGRTKRKGNRGNRRNAGARQQGAAGAADPAAGDAQWMSGYDGANQSLRRGHVFIDLDTRKELDSFSRQELLRRVRWLYINQGFVRGIVRNGSALVGWLTPQAKGGKKWSKRAEERFRRRTSRAKNFDRAGKFNFRSAQGMIKRVSKKDGDVLTVLTTNEEGTAPAVAFYEAHQMANHEDTPAGHRWVDGVLLGSKSDRHIAYGLRDESGKVVVVPAGSVIYFGAFDSPGHVRAVSPLAHGVNHAMDITEIRADTKHAIKTAGLEGLIRTRSKDAAPTKARQGLPGVLGTQTVSGKDGDRRLQTLEVFGGGQVPDLDPGEDLKLLHDSRPHPNGMLFQDELYRDIAAGYGMDVETIYKLGKMTGPGVRFLLDKLSRWISEEQEALSEWALQVWLYFIAWDLVHGELEFPKEGKDWMAVEMMPQRDLTIDRGAVAKQLLDLIDAGLMTHEQYHKIMNGLPGEDVWMDKIKEVAAMKKACKAAGLEYGEVFRARAGTAGVETAADAKPDPDAEEEEEPEESDE